MSEIRKQVVRRENSKNSLFCDTSVHQKATEERFIIPGMAFG